MAPLVRPPRRHGHRRPGREADRPARRQGAGQEPGRSLPARRGRRWPTWSGWARSRPTTWSRRSRRARPRTLDRFLTGLTIRHVGTRMAEIIAGRVKTLDAAPRRCRWPSSRRSPRSARSSRPASTSYFQDPENQQLLDDLQAVGVSPEPLQPPRGPGRQARRSPGKTFVLTGTLPKRIAARGRGADQAARGQGQRLGLEGDQLRPGRRGGRQQARKGQAARHPGHRRGRVRADGRRRRMRRYDRRRRK